MAELSGNGHIMSMENKRNRHYFTTTVVFLGIQTLIILFIYPIVIGIVVVSFQNDIMKLEISIDNLKTHKDLQHASDTEPETEQRCTCSETVSENDVTTQVGSSTLRCCTTDEDSVRMLILRIIDEDRRQRNRKRRPDRTTLTVGAIERLVSNIIKQNKTEHAVDTGSNSNTMPSTSIITIAVHLTGRPSLNGFTDSKQLHRQKGYKKVGPWEYNNGQSFARYVQVDDHHIIVPKTGIYYVYSQAYFLDDSTEEERQETDIQEYLHYTVRENESYQPDPINLMKSGRTQRNSDFYYSSFHSGLFRLTENDKIYMKVYLPRDSVWLDNQQQSTFMGMFLLSGDD